MKKTIIILILFLLVLTPSKIYASEGLIKPTSRFYFLQTWGEQIKLFFTRSSEQKLNYLLELTERRVDEMADNPSLVVTNRYEGHFKQLNELATQVQNKEQAAEKIRETNLSQQQVLSGVYSQVPEQAKDVILNAQENSSKHVAKTIETVEGSQKAQEYAAQVAQIQQAEKMGQVERLEQAPMESSPNSDPSQNTPKELKGANPLREGQPLNPLNPAQDTQGNEGGNRMQPAEPVQMNQPAGQN
jgi:hypothetical protein